MVMPARRRTLLSILLLARAALATSLAAGAPCPPTGRAGDSATASCFGWCSVAFASSHCDWCACSGCGWCTSAGTATPTLPSTSAGGALATRSVGSNDVGTCDAAQLDCESFCAPQYKATHCSLCKCRACAFCKCSSGIADDVDEEQCQSWCQLEHSESHCTMCKCRGCSFCAAGAGDTSKNAPRLEIGMRDAASMSGARPGGKAPHDAGSAGGAYFGAYSTAGGPLAVLGASATASNVGAAVALARVDEQCTPANPTDVDFYDCQLFCSPTFRADHCSLCKCAGCNWCACSSTHAGDVPRETCAPWCETQFHRSHCDWCSCKGCSFCRVGVPCDSFYPDDSPTEKCEDFCDVAFHERHCEMVRECGSFDLLHGPGRS